MSSKFGSFIVLNQVLLTRKIPPGSNSSSNWSEVSKRHLIEATCKTYKAVGRHHWVLHGLFAFFCLPGKWRFSSAKLTLAGVDRTTNVMPRWVYDHQPTTTFHIAWGHLVRVRSSINTPRYREINPFQPYRPLRHLSTPAILIL